MSLLQNKKKPYFISNQMPIQLKKEVILFCNFYLMFLLDTKKHIFKKNHGFFNYIVPIICDFKILT